MAVHDESSQRLFVSADLAGGTIVRADRTQANYLLNVLRMKNGDEIRLFNGRDGEWSAILNSTGRKQCDLAVEQLTRSQQGVPGLHLVFAPLKQARLDYLVQKSVEMGVGILQPVLTQHTQVRKLNLNRVKANVIEAAEQCGILYVPQVREPVGLVEFVKSSGEQLEIVFCDEQASSAAGPAKLQENNLDRCALLVGPEGGFSQLEREQLLGNSNVTSISLGPRILRGDTAAVAGLALLQSQIGDWYTNR